MSESQPAGTRRQIAPRDVFDRSNMPSRWERLTGVAPKIAEDKRFLAFMAARYSGEERHPDPGTLVAPDELRQKQNANLVGGCACVFAIVLGVIGLSANQPIVLGIATLGLIAAVVGMVVVSMSTAAAIANFQARKSQCEAAHARLHCDSLDPEYRSTLTP